MVAEFCLTQTHPLSSACVSVTFNHGSSAGWGLNKFHFANTTLPVGCAGRGGGGSAGTMRTLHTGREIRLKE